MVESKFSRLGVELDDDEDPELLDDELELLDDELELLDDELELLDDELSCSTIENLIE